MQLNVKPFISEVAEGSTVRYGFGLPLLVTFTRFAPGATAASIRL